jgi:hypothetical protein
MKGPNPGKPNADDLIFSASLMEEKPKKEQVSNDISLALIKLEENLKKFKMKSKIPKENPKKRKKEIVDLNRPPKKVEEIIDPETLAEIKKQYKPVKIPFAERHKIRNIDERVQNVEKTLEEITKAAEDPTYGIDKPVYSSPITVTSAEPIKIFQPKQYHSSMAMAMQEMLVDTILNEPERPEAKNLKSSPPFSLNNKTK